MGGGNYPAAGAAGLGLLVVVKHLAFILVALCSSSALASSPDDVPFGFPWRVRGTLIYGAGSVGPTTAPSTMPTGVWLVAEYSMNLGGWRLTDGGGYDVTLFANADGVIQDSAATWSGDWGNGVIGSPLVGPGASFVPVEVDDGLGWKLQPTFTFVFGGMLGAVALFLVFKMLGQPLNLFKRLGF